MHYYQFNIGDYRRDAAHLEPMEHYIYRTLIDWYYLDEAPIPKDNHVVMRRLKLGLECVKNVENVLLDFFHLLEDGWHHKRINEDIANYYAKAEKNKENGKLGGRPKKTQSVNLGFEKKPKDNPNESQNNPNQEPLTINQEPIIKPKRKKIALVYEDYPEFLEFWSAYPNKDKKQEALEAWVNIKPPIEKVMQALSWQTRSDKWMKDGGSFVPLPTTYINGARWESEPPKEVTF